MLNVRCLQSGSAGNSYAIDDGETALLLEAGIASKKMAAGYGDLLPRAAGCLITHEHMDHAAGAAGLTDFGIGLYASKGTLAALQGIRRPYRCHPVEPLKQRQLGSWQVLPFPTEHDSAQPLGFLLYSEAAKEKVLFATDTHFIAYRFQGLTAVMVECNYSRHLLEESVRAGAIPQTLKRRLEQSHFSLEDCRAFLLGTDLSRVHDIYLLHLSKQNANRALFKREIVRAAGAPVTVF